MKRVAWSAIVAVSQNAVSVHPEMASFGPIRRSQVFAILDVAQLRLRLRTTHAQSNRYIVKKNDIENISLGPRQLLFDFEKDKSKEQAMVISCIENKIEKCGYVALDECVQYVKEANELSDAAIIQYIFWLAKDLKVHFRLDGEHLEP
ncbi:MAG: hypothetical protein U9Q05_13950, partial [Thermodesulfobacteriota bacterium]|nr:hypothetical protein [Thermodesulfobacteriota bacterium]